jgi:hypothetical protein
MIRRPGSLRTVAALALPAAWWLGMPLHQSVAGQETFVEPAGVVHLSDFEPDLPSDDIPDASPAPAATGPTAGVYDQDAPPAAPAGVNYTWFNPYADRVTYDPRVPESEAPFHWKAFECLPELLTGPDEPLAGLFGFITHAEHDEPQTGLDPYAIGIQSIPDRPSLVFECNEGFLKPGWLSQGVETPTGAVWRPSIWVFGTYRTAYQYLDAHRPGGPVSEWANRLDLFAQVNLTGTERILVGMRPLDEQESNHRDFWSYDFRRHQWLDGLNSHIQTLFFEGDFGEIFPWLDPYDHKMLDYGFSVGRQPILAQQGLLINEDMIDAVTITRNTLHGHGNLNLRITGVYAWNEINRNNAQPDYDAQLAGILTESDFAISTVNADVVYVDSPNPSLGSLVAFGLSAIQRIHGFYNTYNTSLHVLASFPTNGETVVSGQGELLFAQTSWTPHHTDDLIYLNTFWAIDQFTSPARGPLMGGPLGQTGLLFSSPALGRLGAPLNNFANSVVGASLGYQMFFDHTRQQVIFEVGGRQDTNGANTAAIATGVRYQKALGQHWIFIADGIASKPESVDVIPIGRIEFLAKF